MAARRRPRWSTVIVLVAGLTVAAACSDSEGSQDASRDEDTTVASSGCSPARRAEPGTELVTTNVDGVQRDYQLTIPPDYDGTAEAPLLLSIHGFTTTIEQIDNTTRFSSEGAERGYVVVTPQAPSASVTFSSGPVDVPLWVVPGAFEAPAGTSFPDRDDVAFLIGLLDELESTLCVDTAREYVAGISNGAQMTVELICQHDERFAAAAPVAGANIPSECRAEHATSIVAFHGTADELVSYEGGASSTLGVALAFPPVEERMADLAALGDCGTVPLTTQPHEDVRHLVWDCPSPLGLELYAVIDGGHTWPGGSDPDATTGEADLIAQVGSKTMSIDATDLILDFFDEHVR